MSAEPPIAEAIGVSRTLPGPVPVHLVQDISLTVERGAFIAITGPSGSGKSSLLYLLGLLDRPDAGRIMLDGEDTATLDADDLAQLRLQHIGFIFQFHFLLPEFSVLENVLLPMRRLGEAMPGEMRDRAGGLLEALGLANMRGKLPGQLSGGERQRAAIARALANAPSLLLADEPTGNLDTKNAEIVFDIFRRIAHEDRRAVITVTHNPDLAAMTDRAVHLIDGRIADKPAIARA